MSGFVGFVIFLVLLRGTIGLLFDPVGRRWLAAVLCILGPLLAVTMLLHLR